MIPLRCSLTAVLLLAAALGTPAAPCRAEAGTIRPAVWTDLAGEGADLVSAPLRGSWEDYALAAAWGGALAAALSCDLEAYGAVQDRSTPWQDQVMPVVTWGGEGWVHVGAYAALYALGRERDRRIAVQAVEGQVWVAVGSVLLKAAFTSPRPTPAAEPNPRRWFTLDLSDNSFPSGHAMTAFCAAAILGRQYQVEWLTYPLAVLVAYSRVYTQRHFPADVVAGAGLGLFIGHTVLAYHDRQDAQQEAIQVSLRPEADGAKVVVAWRY